MIISITIVSSIQMLIVCGILQLALPASITGAIYESDKLVPCYKELDIDG